MNPRHPNQQAFGTAFGCCLVVFLGLLGLTPLGTVLIHLSYELPFLTRPQMTRDEAVIIYMDDDSMRELGQPMHAQWDRKIHARMIEQLQNFGAKAIGFDVLMEYPSEPEADEALLKAQDRHGHVFFGASVEPIYLNGQPISIHLSKPFSDRLTYGIAEISTKGKAIRQLFRDTEGTPSLAWAIAQSVSAKPLLDPTKPRWVNYYGPPGTLPHFSYSAVLKGAIPPQVFSNKVVFIGAHVGIGFLGGVGTDYAATPYTLGTGTMSPGVEVVATVFLNLLHHEWLTEMPVWLEVLLMALSGTGLVWSLSYLSPTKGSVLAVFLALGTFAIACLLEWRAQFWFPWLVIVVVQIPAALLYSLLGHTRRLQCQQETLAVELAAARLTPTSAKSQDQSSGVGGFSPALYAPPVPRPTSTIQDSTSFVPTIPDHVVLREIGEGAFGDVWLARDVIGTYHAVKVVRRRRFREAAPFEREFSGIQKFTPISRSHAGFVHILHVGRNDEAGYFYYIMELGDDVKTGQRIDPDSYTARTLDNERKRQKRILPRDLVEIGSALSSALHHLHEHQLIHRDIKPANVIFVNGKPKLADIGLVTRMSDAANEVTFIGTPEFMAPEGPGSASADVYGLGKLLYVLFTGLPAGKFPELPTDLLETAETDSLVIKLNKIILKACEREARERFQTAAEIFAELGKLRIMESKPDESIRT